MNRAYPGYAHHHNRRREAVRRAVEEAAAKRPERVNAPAEHPIDPNPGRAVDLGGRGSQR